MDLYTEKNNTYYININLQDNNIFVYAYDLFDKNTMESDTIECCFSRKEFDKGIKELINTSKCLVVNKDYSMKIEKSEYGFTFELSMGSPTMKSYSIEVKEFNPLLINI